jgi:protein SCO1/2
VAALCALAGGADAQQSMQAGQSSARDAQLKQVRLDQRLNQKVPFDARFLDEAGKPVTIGDYHRDKPVMTMLIQYRCSRLCVEQINVLLDTLKGLKFTPGKEFNLLIVSIDPREGPELAKEMKSTFMERFQRPGAAAGVHFLTGDKSNIDYLAHAVGFYYFYDEATDQYAHKDGLVLTTPHGTIARYYFALNYDPSHVRLGLVEAGKGKIGTPLDQIALLCFHYNPVTGKYGLAVLNLVKVGGVGTVLALAFGVLWMRRKDRLATRGEGEPGLNVARAER